MFKINDVFWTFQGEGTHWGRRALFIRMPKCNLKCSWCDTEFDSYKEWSVEQLTDVMRSEKARFAVLTGGEPLMNEQSDDVIELLKQEGFEVAVETNGTFPPKARIDWFTCSPKKDAAYKIHRDLKKRVNDYKYVVDEGFDFSILDRHKDEAPYIHLFLSPEFNDFKGNLEKIYAYIKTNPRWRINLQTHKWMGVP